MMVREFLRGLLIMLVLGLFAVVDAQEGGPWRSGVKVEEKDFGYESWPGKNGTIRRSIELSVTSLSGYGLQLAPGFNDSTVFLKIPLSEDDALKKGRLQIDVYRTIEEAQLAIVEFFYTMTRPWKFPRLTDKEFQVGDVAFGEESKGVFFVVFTRANVRIILRAPTRVAKELAGKVDGAVQNAPAWKLGDPRPALIISEEFKQAFFSGRPRNLR